MKISNLKWNVLREDINRREIVLYNVFDRCDYVKAIEDIKKAIKKDEIDKTKFSELLQRESKYCFQYKAEYEVVVTSWPAYVSAEEIERLKKEKEENQRYHRFNVRLDIGSKIDIYKQLELNWDRFVDYVWNACVN